MGQPDHIQNISSVYVQLTELCVNKRTCKRVNVQTYTRTYVRIGLQERDLN